MPKYILNKNAKQDIRTIAFYTLDKHGVYVWKKYRSLLYKNFQTIADVPIIGNQNYMSEKQIKNNIHKVTAGKHYILYKKNTNTNDIDIIGLIHTSHNLKRADSKRYLDIRAEPKTTPTKKSKTKKSRGR